MNFITEKSSLFHADVANQFDWYSDEAGEEVAWRFFHAADQNLPVSPI